MEARRGTYPIEKALCLQDKMKKTGPFAGSVFIFRQKDRKKHGKTLFFGKNVLAICQALC